MKQRAGADHVALLVQRDATAGDGPVEVFECLVEFVYERLVDERPQMLGRLQLRAMRWLEHEPDAIGYGEVSHQGSKRTYIAARVHGVSQA